MIVDGLEKDTRCERDIHACWAYREKKGRYDIEEQLETPKIAPRLLVARDNIPYSLLSLLLQK